MSWRMIRRMLGYRPRQTGFGLKPYSSGGGGRGLLPSPVWPTGTEVEGSDRTTGLVAEARLGSPAGTGRSDSLVRGP